MLIGCGCHCEQPSVSQFPSGSFHSSGFGASELQSGSLPGGPIGYCGACYNLPSEWRVALSSSWWNYIYPSQDHDCRAALGGTFILRPYGAASLSSGAATYINNAFGSAPDYCTIWKSDELAQYVSRLEQNGTPNPGCRTGSPPFVSRVELASFTLPGFPDTTNFMLFVWWLRRSAWNPENQEGQWWGWTVNRNPVIEPPKNCVRCFGADVGIPIGFFNAYTLNLTYQPEWDVVTVCPN